MQGQQSTFTNRKIYRSKQLDKEFSEIQFDYSALLTFLPMYNTVRLTTRSIYNIRNGVYMLVIWCTSRKIIPLTITTNNNNKSNSTRFAKCRSIWRFRSVKSHDLIQTLITV